jgi:hypothetical protein
MRLEISHRALPSVMALAVFLSTPPLEADDGGQGEVEDAQPASEEDPETLEAIAHFNKGVAFFDKEDYAAAAVEFLESFKLKAHWAVRYNIGVCYQKTGRPVDAIEQFELYLQEGGDEVPPDREAEVEERLAELEKIIGHLMVDVSEHGAVITIDDVRKFASPMVGPAPVKTGFHKVKIRKAGFEEVVTEVTVASGADKTIDIQMVPLESRAEAEIVVEPGPDEPEEVEVEDKKAEKPLRGIWIGLGTGASLAAAGGITGGLALKSNKEKVDAQEGCESTMTPDDCPRAYEHSERARALMIASNVLLAAAGVAALTGLVIFLTDEPVVESDEENPPDEPEVSVAPIIGPGREGGMVGVQTIVNF